METSAGSEPVGLARLLRANYRHPALSQRLWVKEGVKRSICRLASVDL